MSPFQTRDPKNLALHDEVIRCIATLNRNLHGAHDVNDAVETSCPVGGPDVHQWLRGALTALGRVRKSIRFETSEGKSTLHLSVKGSDKEAMRIELLRLHLSLLGDRHDAPLLMQPVGWLRDESQDPYTLLAELLGVVAESERRLVREYVKQRELGPLQPVVFTYPTEASVNEELRSLRERVAKLEAARGPQR